MFFKTIKIQTIMDADLEYRALSVIDKTAIHYDERRDKMLHCPRNTGFSKEEVKEFLELVR